jgi:hypothetical protein
MLATIGVAMILEQLRWPETGHSCWASVYVVAIMDSDVEKRCWSDVLVRKLYLVHRRSVTILYLDASSVSSANSTALTPAQGVTARS